jgi:hypothetical protein
MIETNLSILDMEDVESKLNEHAQPIPRNFEMRIDRLQMQVFGAKIARAEVLLTRWSAINRADWRWNNIVSFFSNLYKNHIAYTREIRLGRMEERSVHQCELCGSLYGSVHPRSRDTLWGRVNSCCEQCNRDSWKCPECGEWKFGHDDKWNIAGNWYDADCYQDLRASGAVCTCEVCDCETFWDDTYETNSGTRICSMCSDERIFHCVDCGLELIDGRDRFRWIDDDPYCPNCYSERAVVAQYDHYIENPPMLLLPGEKQRPDTLFFGLEFEIEDSWSNFEVSEWELGKRCLECVPKDWGYCKHDGSMHRGVEYVTHPQTPLFYKANKKAYDEMLHRWKAEGFRTDQFDEENDRYNCGLHMHMSKDAFTSGHLYKFVRFFYKMPLRKLVQQISERDANYYARWAYDDAENGVQLAKEKKNISGQRYSVINLIGGHWHEQNVHKPAKTVEFRLFQGTLEPAILHKNIEFLISVFFFTRDNSITHITEKNYLRFLGATPNKWRHLAMFLRDKLGKEI